MLLCSDVSGGAMLQTLVRLATFSRGLLREIGCIFDANSVLLCCYIIICLPPKYGGASRDRTDDPLLAKQVLSQLSYSPSKKYLVGQGGLEPPTSPLSGVRSNQLSYRPNVDNCL